MVNCSRDGQGAADHSSSPSSRSRRPDRSSGAADVVLREVVVQRRAQSAQGLRALGAAGRLAGGLHRGQQQHDQDGDDGDDD